MSHGDGWPPPFSMTSKIRKPNSPIRYRPPATSSEPRTALTRPAIALDLVRFPPPTGAAGSAKTGAGDR